MTNEIEKSNRNLYEITREHQELMDQLLNSEGEINEATENQLAVIQDHLVTKAGSIINCIDRMESEIDLAKKRINDLKEYISKRENALERMKTYTIQCMENLNLKKIEGDFYSLSIRKPSKVLNIVDSSNVPAHMIEIKQEFVIKKNELKKYILDGHTVNGCYIDDGKKSLQIRIK